MKGRSDRSGVALKLPFFFFSGKIPPGTGDSWPPPPVRLCFRKSGPREETPKGRTPVPSFLRSAV